MEHTPKRTQMPHTLQTAHILKQLKELISWTLTKKQFIILCALWYVVSELFWNVCPGCERSEKYMYFSQELKSLKCVRYSVPWCEVSEALGWGCGWRVRALFQEMRSLSCLNYSVPGCVPSGSDSKESACNTRDPGTIPWLRRSPGEGNGHPF